MAHALVRPSTEADLPRIHEIYNDAILTGTATWDYEPWPWERRLGWWSEHEHDPTCPVFVAEADGAVAGFSYLSHFREKAGYRFTREDTVYVDPALHRRGMGSALVSAVVDHARAGGMRAVIGGIVSTNEASLELHRRLGFVETARMPAVGYKFGCWLDLVFVQLTFPEFSPA
jgi:phosphinothricin acetyltransferase